MSNSKNKRPPAKTLPVDKIIDALPVAMFYKDYSSGDGVIVGWNDKAEEFMGLSKEEVLGKTDFELFPKDQAEFFRAKDLETISSGKMVYIDEEPIDSDSLGRRWVKTWKVPIENDVDGSKFLLGISMDITTQKKLEDDLIEEKRKSQEFSIDFVADLALFNKITRT